MSLFKKLTYGSLCAGLFLALIGIQPAYAASLTVNSAADTLNSGDGVCTLREAIINANNDNQSGSTDCAAGSGADVITFAANYTITLVGSQLPAVTSQITITGNGSANTIVQASTCNPVTLPGGCTPANYRVFEVSAAGNLTLDGLTVRHGRCDRTCPLHINTGGGIYNAGTLTLINSTVSDNYAGYEGGGIYIRDGALTVTNSALSGNYAGNDGGGIYNFSGTLTITNSALSGNSGSGIYNGGTATVTNSTLSGNSTPLGNGGGIDNGGTLTITNSTLSGNSAPDGSGGGISNAYGTTDITDSTLSNNSAYYDGGGIFNYGSLTIKNSTLSSNTSSNGSGGGVFHTDRNDMSVSNSTFSGNIALTGGGIYNDDATVTLINSTFSGNLATFGDFGGSGIFNAGDLNYSNTIIANSIERLDCFTLLGPGTIGTNVNNLVEDGSCPSTFTGDPNLGSLQDNGGPTQTHALLTGSTAIDAGNAAVCAAAPVNNLDQRGVTRPQGAGCDIGSYEVDTSFPTVVSTSLVPSYTTGPGNFTVTYSENVYDPAGDSNPDDVTNPANYIVAEDGANGAFDTVSCSGGLAGDDTQLTITGITYNAALYTATVTLSAAAPDGTYRLFVCGTTSIVDPVMNELNNGLSDYTFDFTVRSAATQSFKASALPTTGFAPNRVTVLPQQPAELTYAKMSDIWLEIPSQKIKSNIVGVPQSKDHTWNVGWLGSDTGWLNGTAFPTWNGNSVITAHVTDANGLPGPFANIKNLKYDDKIIVHLFGQQYIYEVQESRLMRPSSTGYTFQSMQDHSYLTLITCQGYIPFSNTYFFRRVVRAVLVEVR